MFLKTRLKIPAKDKQIWDWAKKNGYTIVTNAEDFYLLLLTYGFPPKVVLIRTGNQSTNLIVEVLLRYKEQIKTMVDSKESLQSIMNGRFQMGIFADKFLVSFFKRL